MLNISLQHKMMMKLSPQQVQYLKMLQLPTLALEQKIKAELEMNPLLEEGFEEEMELTQEQEDAGRAKTPPGPRKQRPTSDGPARGGREVQHRRFHERRPVRAQGPGAVRQRGEGRAPRRRHHPALPPPPRTVQPPRSGRRRAPRSARKSSATSTRTATSGATSSPSSRT